MNNQQITDRIAYRIQQRKADLFKNYRQENNITHEDIKEISGLSRPTIIAIENNRDTYLSSFYRYLVAIELIVLAKHEKQEVKEQLEDENMF